MNIGVDSRTSGVDSLTGSELKLSVLLSVLSRSRLVLYWSGLERVPVTLTRLGSSRDARESTRVSDIGSEDFLTYPKYCKPCLETLEQDFP